MRKQLVATSRNVAFKAAKIADSVLAGQSEILMREVARDDVPNDEEAFDDLGRSADLCIFHQDVADTDQIADIANKSTMLDVRTGCQCQQQSQQGDDAHHFQSLSLD